MKERIQMTDVRGEIMRGRKHFARIDEAAELYSVGQTTFRQLAKDAGAIYHIRKICLVNLDKIDKYMENFCDTIDHEYEF